MNFLKYKRAYRAVLYCYSTFFGIIHKVFLQVIHANLNTVSIPLCYDCIVRLWTGLSLM